MPGSRWAVRAAAPPGDPPDGPVAVVCAQLASAGRKSPFFESSAEDASHLGSIHVMMRPTSEPEITPIQELGGRAMNTYYVNFFKSLIGCNGRLVKAPQGSTET